MNDIYNQLVPFGDRDLFSDRIEFEFLEFIRRWYHPELPAHGLRLIQLEMGLPARPWMNSREVTVMYCTKRDEVKPRGGAWRHRFHMYVGNTASIAFTAERKRVRYPD